MLQINVAQLLKASIGEVRNYEVDDFVDIAGKDTHVQGDVELTRTDRSILVKGNLHMNVELTCSRCLNVFSDILALNIEEEYFPTIDVNAGNAVPRPEDTEAFTIDEHNVLDLTEAVRQYAVMSVPMKPLCRVDCAGLCPTCGYNLNQGDCGCPKTVDPRWAKLSQLILADNKTSGSDQKGKK